MQLPQLLRDGRVVLAIKKKLSKLYICLEPEPFVVGALEALEGQGVESFHASYRLRALGTLLDEVQYVIDRFL
jgi:hypothetical protein